MLVFEFEEVKFCGAVISLERILDDEEMYFAGSVRGDGAKLEEGHSSVKPAGD